MVPPYGQNPQSSIWCRPLDPNGFFCPEYGIRDIQKKPDIKNTICQMEDPNVVSF